MAASIQDTRLLHKINRCVLCDGDGVLYANDLLTLPKTYLYQVCCNKCTLRSNLYAQKQYAINGWNNVDKFEGGWKENKEADPLYAQLLNLKACIDTGQLDIDNVLTDQLLDDYLREC